MTDQYLSAPHSRDLHAVICAWCGRFIRKRGAQPISRGICLSRLGDSFNYPIENLAGC
jgi:hypothetical protein